MNFDRLIKQVEQTHDYLQRSAVAAVNINLTLRNWLIGLYIVEFEQKGSDRAAYGDRLLEKMAEKLRHIRGLSYRNLNNFRLFYLTYPHLKTLFTNYQTIADRHLRSVVSGIIENQSKTGLLSPDAQNSGDVQIRQTATAESTQLNTYVSYYRKNMMQPGDKPCIGILLCAAKDETFVEYALAGLDEKIFVSQYLLYIPAKEKLKKFMRSEMGLINQTPL